MVCVFDYKNRVRMVWHTITCADVRVSFVFADTLDLTD